MYYKWRDQLLMDGAKLFERGGVAQARERLERENRKRILRLMKENHLLVPKNRFFKAPRKAKTQKPRTIIRNRY